MGPCDGGGPNIWRWPFWQGTQGSVQMFMFFPSPTSHVEFWMSKSLPFRKLFQNQEDGEDFFGTSVGLVLGKYLCLRIVEQMLVGFLMILQAILESRDSFCFQKSLIPRPPLDIGLVMCSHFLRQSIFFPDFFFPHQKSLWIALSLVVMDLGSAKTDM